MMGFCPGVMLVMILTTCFCMVSSNKVMQFIDQNLLKRLEGEACSGRQQLGRCSIVSSCTQVRCTANLSADPVKLIMTVQRCSDPVTITTQLKSPDSKLDWTQRFTKSDSVPVPGFSFQHASVIVGASLNSTFEVINSLLHVKISFQYGINTTILKTDEVLRRTIPFSRNGCWFLVWWRAKSETVRMAIIVALVILIMLLLSGCCCCCCCNSCKRKRKRRTLKEIKTTRIRARYIHLSQMQKGYGNPNFQESSKSLKNSVRFASVAESLAES